MEAESHASSFTPAPHASALLCDGTEFQMHGTGTWKGHFLPGVIFLTWGIWWAVRSFRTYQKARLAGLQYHSRGWWSGCWSAEPFLKVLGPPVGILVELWLDHDHLLSLYCADGRFATGNIHNYQHAASYPAFIVSGLVDLLGMRWTLPEGTEKAFLSLAFGIEAFLMSIHKKHEALDQIVHWLLALTMWACAISILMEVAWKHSVLPSAARSLSCIMQGMWLIQIGHIMYSGIVPWLADESAAGTMLAPVIFAMLVLLEAVVVLGIYCATQAWTGSQPQRHQRLPLSDVPEDFEDSSDQKDDSAHEDSGSEGEPALRRGDASDPRRGSAQKLVSSFQMLIPGRERHAKGSHIV